MLSKVRAAMVGTLVTLGLGGVFYAIQADARTQTRLVAIEEHQKDDHEVMKQHLSQSAAAMVAMATDRQRLTSLETAVAEVKTDFKAAAKDLSALNLEVTRIRAVLERQEVERRASR